MSRLLRGGILLLVAMLCVLLGTGVSHAESPLVERYTAPDGMVITSHSPSWDSQTKLKSLHEELLKNTHGEEIELLDEIVVHDDYPRGKGVAGQYIFQTVGTIIPGTKQKMQPGKIELYGGREHQTVASFAHTLAHEYGHHVTHYYTLQADGYPLTDEKRWSQTSYARMRGLTHDDRIAVEGVDHRWQVAEVAAEDYVQLFGSPLAKAPTPFESRIEQAMRGQEPSAMSWNASMYNVQPQENILLPLASDVPHLYEFFHQRMKGEPGTYTPPKKPELKLVSYAEQANAGYQLKFEWEMPGEKDNYTYTLVTYGENDLLAEPIVTRKAGEAKEARYGSVVVQRGSYLYTYQEPNAKGLRHFKLYSFGDNNWVSESAELTVDMANPTEVKVNEKKVVPVAAAPADETALDVWDIDLMLFDIDLSWLVSLIGWAADFINGVLTALLG
ncbi:hypothetical protein OS242_03055 [Tumebacillus sp. DT12]|uniref:Uncharacterized protein n=1 Tax=Tumebacillus lacus TaxID=2995335 RepID=A0ABT3X2J4_9BACL|nr:hypothetical protein [Tumebacillus lacus]MCX7568939.1 hypothetical protein [Tumebacillus lacus]